MIVNLSKRNLDARSLISTSHLQWDISSYHQWQILCLVLLEPVQIGVKVPLNKDLEIQLLGQAFIMEKPTVHK